jgi:hypothetical protein
VRGLLGNTRRLLIDARRLFRRGHHLDQCGGDTPVPFYLYGGALKLDRSAQPYTYERVLVAEAGSRSTAC